MAIRFDERLLRVMPYDYHSESQLVKIHVCELLLFLALPAPLTINVDKLANKGVALLSGIWSKTAA